jgi:hypothetical protein
LDSFTVAVFLFWLSFFANQRGCSLAFRNALLPQLISTATGKILDWLTENFKACSELWNKIHDKLLADFSDHISDICEGWLKSPAGRYYKGLIEKARYGIKELERKLTSTSSAKKPNPELSVEQMLNGFVDCEKEYPGIPVNDYDSVFSVFEDIIRCCDFLITEDVRDRFGAMF